MTTEPPDPLRASEEEYESKVTRTEEKSARTEAKLALQDQRKAKAARLEQREAKAAHTDDKLARQRLREAREAARKAKELPGGQLEWAVGKLRDRIGEIAAQPGSVLVGPFTGEVGFELLYWIPLVRWAVQEFPELQGRLVVVSRGGVAHWWQSFVEADYVDIFSLYDPDEYMARVGPTKQRGDREAGGDILDRVRSTLGVDGVSFHPSVLFDFYYEARRIDPDAFVRRVQPRPGGAEGLAALYDPIPKPTPDGPLEALLPEDFVAVRFYFRPSFPDTPENRRFAAETIATLSRAQPVVVLNNRLELDDHSDLDELPPGTVTIDHLMTPENNLDIQTRALARSRAFIGTYGGLSYLAPLLQVPAVGFSSEPHHTHPWHQRLAENLFVGDPFAQLVTLRPGDISVLDELGRGLMPSFGR